MAESNESKDFGLNFWIPGTKNHGIKDHAVSENKWNGIVD